MDTTHAKTQHTHQRTSAASKASEHRSRSSKRVSPETKVELEPPPVPHVAVRSESLAERIDELIEIFKKGESVDIDDSLQFSFEPPAINAGGAE